MNNSYKKILSIFLFTVFFGMHFFVSQQVYAASPCPISDGGVGDNDGTINGTIEVNADATWNAQAAESGVVSCAGLDIVINSGVTVTLLPANDGDTDYSEDFPFILIADTVTVEGTISANEKGYATLTGPGVGVSTYNYGAGGGYGGFGGTIGDAAGGPVYGNPLQPLQLGSGGGRSQIVGSSVGGSGGGSFKISATDIIVNGTITANGKNGYDRGAGGSGGGIWLQASNSISGAGIISAQGGSDGANTGAGGGDRCSSGGGGKIVLEYNSSTFSGTKNVAAGTDGNASHRGVSGSIIYYDTSSSTVTVQDTQQWIPESTSSFTDWFSGVSNFVVTNSATLKLESGDRTSDSTAFGSNIEVDSFTVDSGSTVTANGLGYDGKKGPGVGASNYEVGAGGGHGGAGGSITAYSATAIGGSTYGSSTNPITPGSGGGESERISGRIPGDGGGVIQITANDIAINGTMSANGNNGYDRGAGGAGGSIYLIARDTLSGTGTVTANGGTDGSGGDRSAAGGGGRIAMYYGASTFSGSYSVAKGTDGTSSSQNGSDGTTFFSIVPGISTLQQFGSDGITTISTGGSLNESSMVFSLNVTSANSSANISPEIELKEVGTDFVNIPTATGSAVTFLGSSIAAPVSVSGLTDLSSYHWQIRGCDSNNVCSNWTSYGGNAESTADFTVVLNATPNNPTIPGSSTFIDGQRTNDSTPTFLFTQSDPDVGNQVKYQIQVDNDSDFSSVIVDYTSALAAQGSDSFSVGQAEGSGTYTTGSSATTLSEDNYYWRIKTIDENNGESSWVSAAGTPAFVVDTTSPTNVVTTSMRAYAAHGTTHTDDSQVVWFSREDMYFSWNTDGDTSGLKGYCVYLGTDENGDASSQKGLLGTSPVSTTGSNCQFITDDTSIDFSNTALRGSTWLSSSSAPYYFKIRPIDTANNAGQNDTASSTFSFYFDGAAPSNVSTISAASGSLSSIGDMNFYWPTSGAQAATDAGSGILGYQYAVNSTSTWRGTLTDATTGLEYIATNSAQPFTLDSDVVGDDIIVGSNVLYFRTVDKAGNASTYTTAPLEYGGEAPSFDDADTVTVTPSTNTANSFAFSWPEATPSDGRTIDKYYYMVNTAPPALYQTITSNSATYVPTTATSIAATALTNIRKGSNTIYVVAVDDNGNYSQSNYIYGNFTLNSTLPDSPQSLVASDASVKTASLWRTSLAWAAPDYKGTGTLTYTVQRSNDAETWSDIDSTSGLAFLDTLSSSELYYWRVAATDSSDESIASPSYSSAVSLTPKGAFTEPAELTSGPAASSITTKRATITWTTARTSDSKVALGTSSDNYGEEETSNSTQVSDHTINLINLEPGTTYYYKAKWTDEDGNTGESEEKSFKTDPAPVVKDVVIKNIGVDSALVEFTTVGASSANINYGKSTSFGGIETISTSTLETTYAVQLSDLDDGTKYYFKIDTKDSEEDTYVGTILDFETLPRPEVSNVRVQQVANTAQSSIQVTWESNTAISSIITFYPESNPEYARDAVDIELIDGEHEMIVPGLLPETSYILIVKGRDRIGNEAISDNLRFTTATDTRPPRMTDLVVEGTNVPQVNSTAQESNSQLVVTWTTDEPSTSQVEYGDGTGITYSQTTQEDQTLTYNHLVIVSGLTPSKVYHLRAISRDSAGNVAESVDTVTITPKATDNAFDLVITNLREVFGFIGNL